MDVAVDNHTDRGFRMGSGPALAGTKDWKRAALLTVSLSVMYGLADFALNKYALGDGWTIMWPLNGITVGLLIMRPRSDWPAIFAGTFLGVGTGEYFDGNSLLLVVTQRLFSATEVGICAIILPRFESLERWLRTRRATLRLYLALLAGPGVSGVMAAWFAWKVQGRPFPDAFDGWAVADALGIAATLPLVLSLRSNEMRRLFQLGNLPKTLGTLGLCFGVVYLTFSCSRYPLLFLLYPSLLLVDSLLSFAGASMAAMGVCLFSVYLTIHRPGPFVKLFTHTSTERDVALQFFLGFQLAALFPASVAFLERRWMVVQVAEANARLTQLAETDGLTGIANRRVFDERFAMEWKAAARNGADLAVLIVDLDSFKQYNDHYGHLAGDECLRKVAGILGSVARRPHDLAARYGGEEFVLQLPGTSLEGALLLAEELRKAVFDGAGEHRWSSWERVTVSIGCASTTPRLEEPRTGLVAQADKGLYQAKRAGRNTVRARSGSQARVEEDVKV
jgi:diguanylate cyclase (GGDEF)-like protein